MNASDKFDFDEAVLSQMENIRRVARRCLRNPDEIDDLVQETVLKAYASRHRLRDAAKFDRWIAGIARNTAREWNRRAFYRNEREEPMDEIPETPDFRTPHDALEEEEERKQLHRAMGRLNNDDREMLRARYFDEASYGELQQKYGLSYSAVGFRLYRAKARLRKLLTSTAAAFICRPRGHEARGMEGTLLMPQTTPGGFFKASTTFEFKKPDGIEKIDMRAPYLSEFGGPIRGSVRIERHGGDEVRISMKGALECGNENKEGEKFFEQIIPNVENDGKTAELQQAFAELTELPEHIRSVSMDFEVRAPENVEIALSEKASG